MSRRRNGWWGRWGGEKSSTTLRPHSAYQTEVGESGEVRELVGAQDRSNSDLVLVALHKFLLGGEMIKHEVYLVFL